VKEVPFVMLFWVGSLAVETFVTKCPESRDSNRKSVRNFSMEVETLPFLAKERMLTLNWYASVRFTELVAGGASVDETLLPIDCNKLYR
jgi:hypothetical protein